MAIFPFSADAWPPRSQLARICGVGIIVGVTVLSGIVPQSAAQAVAGHYVEVQFQTHWVGNVKTDLQSFRVLKDETTVRCVTLRPYNPGQTRWPFVRIPLPANTDFSVVSYNGPSCYVGNATAGGSGDINTSVRNWSLATNRPPVKQGP